MQIPCNECDPLNAIQIIIFIKIFLTKVLHLCFFCFNKLYTKSLLDIPNKSQIEKCMYKDSYIKKN